MRTVFSIDTGWLGDQTTQSQVMMVRADRSPFNVPQAHIYWELSLPAGSLPDWNSLNAVSLRGQKIRDALRKHPGIAKILDNISSAFNNEILPIYVKLNEGDAELITWESLCDGNDAFLALDRRWPIGRISDPLNGQSRRPPVFLTRIKLMAIISAFDIGSQSTEWVNLFNAAKAARSKGLDVCLKFLVGDEAIRALIEAEIAKGLDWLEVSHVEAPASWVIQTILAWDPNVVHFFCHGFADYELSDQWLELATSSDYLNKNATSGSVKVRANQLVDMSLSLANPWLMTLNSCLSGKASKDLQSMAHAAVSAGFPAAIAMLEPVDASDAHAFTRAFYTALFDKLQQVANVLEHQSRAPFEWAELMCDARQAILDLHNYNGDSDCHEWALPALYVRGLDPVQFERPPKPVGSKKMPVDSKNIAKADKIKLNLIAEWLRSVGEEMSVVDRRRVMEDVLAEIPEQYWPTANGTFADD